MRIYSCIQLYFSSVCLGSVSLGCMNTIPLFSPNFRYCILIHVLYINPRILPYLLKEANAVLRKRLDIQTIE